MRSPSVALICLLLSGNLLAQANRSLGHAPTADEQHRWTSVILPDGRGLPHGAGTAAEGEQVYAGRCAACHGEKGEGRGSLGPRLVGGIGTLATKTPVRTIGSYWPYSTSVWDYIERAMPLSPGPGTLSYDETYSVTAYLLYLNGIIGKDDRMDQSTLPRVRMPNRDGFVQDPRPDVSSRSVKK